MHEKHKISDLKTEGILINNTENPIRRIKNERRRIISKNASINLAPLINGEENKLSKFI